MANEDKPWLNDPVIRPLAPIPVAPPASKEQQDARAANSGVGGFVDSLGRSIASGVTFNLADELAAGGDALLGHYFGRGSQADTIGQRYDANLTAERARDKAFQAEHPILDAAGNIVGGVGGAIVAAPAAVAGPAVSAGRAAANYIGTGAFYGGLAGFGEGEGGLTNRLMSGATGAGVGAVSGGVIGGAANAASGVASRVTHGLGLRDPEVGAERQIIRALDRSGVSVDEAGARLTAPSTQVPEARPPSLFSARRHRPRPLPGVECGFIPDPGRLLLSSLVRNPSLVGLFQESRPPPPPLKSELRVLANRKRVSEDIGRYMRVRLEWEGK